jgi:hypothetical protein
MVHFLPSNLMILCYILYHLQDKRPTYEEWSAELKRVKQEASKDQMSELEKEEELARGFMRTDNMMQIDMM